MKKRRMIAIFMATMFLGITLNVFSNASTSNSGPVTGSGGDITTLSSEM